jgi:hypothetical protein
MNAREIPSQGDVPPVRPGQETRKVGTSDNVTTSEVKQPGEKATGPISGRPNTGAVRIRDVLLGRTSSPGLIDIVTKPVVEQTKPVGEPATEKTVTETPAPTEGEKLFDLPATNEELVTSCLDKKEISKGVTLTPGAFADFAEYDNKETVNGEYGVTLTSDKTGEPIARAGFDVTRDGKVFIGHSPQGGHKDTLSHDARRELVISGFRDKLVNGIVEVAKGLGAEEVVGHSADTHPSVGRTLSRERAEEIMDRVYSRAGFVQDPGDKYYHRRLHH